MKRIHLALVAAATLLVQCNKPADLPDKPALLPAKMAIEDYWGVQLEDPYQYMENMEDTLVRNWMIASSDYARAVLDGISGRQGLIDKMQEFDQRRSDQVTDLTILDNDRYFYLKTTPDDETGKLYMRDGFEGDEKLLFDPDTYGVDSLDYVISGIYPNFEGTRLALTVDPNGSENTTMIIMDVESMDTFPEKVKLTIGPANWLPGGEHFLYTRVNSEDVHDPMRFINTKSYIHRVGTAQEEDRVFFSGEKYPELGIQPAEFPLALYDQYEDNVFIGFFNVENNMIIYVADGKEVLSDRVSWSKVCDRDDQVQNFDVQGDDLYVYTSKGAPDFKVLKTNLWNPDFDQAEVYIPEPGNGLLETFRFTSDACYFTVKSNGTQTKLFKKDESGVSEVELPVAAGSVGIRTKGYKFQDIWVSLTGWTLDGKRYRYHPGDGSFTVEQLSKTAEYPEFDDLIVEELMVPSYDGVKVPLSLIYKKDLVKDGTNPLMIYGYGSYGIRDDPSFSSSRLLWCYHGGIWAVAHVRGGGALGEKWRLAGNKTTKPNTWKDLIACTEYLQQKSYSSPGHTAIMGGSAGGILVGRAMTERPDLYQAVLALVGAMNNTRMEESPNGPTNVPEFGTVKDSVEFMALLEMDSYQHLEEGVKYPATLVTAGMNDPRVIAWQPAKFAARLQACDASDNPQLFLVDYKAGHGIGNTKTKNWENMADYLSFAFWQTGNPDFTR